MVHRQGMTRLKIYSHKIKMMFVTNVVHYIYTSSEIITVNLYSIYYDVIYKEQQMIINFYVSFMDD